LEATAELGKDGHYTGKAPNGGIVIVETVLPRMGHPFIVDVQIPSISGIPGQSVLQSLRNLTTTIQAAAESGRADLGCDAIDQHTNVDLTEDDELVASSEDVQMNVHVSFVERDVHTLRMQCAPHTMRKRYLRVSGRWDRKANNDDYLRHIEL
jgi:hypothetical protein